MTIEMSRLFDQIHDIPKVPEVVKTLITQLNDEYVEVEAIANTVVKDQIISMQVLRVVNSAYFGLPNKVNSISEAVVRLGMSELKTLVIGTGIVSAMPKVEGIELKEFWEDSFCTANYAKTLAKKVDADHEIAFTAGIINNLGRIIIAMGAPHLASGIDELVGKGEKRAFAEEHKLGFTGAEVAAELCHRWEFPEELVQVVQQCQDPQNYGNATKLTYVVYFARILSEARKNELSTDEILENMEPETLAKLNLDKENFSEILPEILDSHSSLEEEVA